MSTMTRQQAGRRETRPAATGANAGAWLRSGANVLGAATIGVNLWVRYGGALALVVTLEIIVTMAYALSIGPDHVLRVLTRAKE